MKVQKEKKNKARSQRGITLVALVVTIIVLIILAAISINLIFSEGGIMSKVVQAQETQKEAEVKEKVQLMLQDYIVERELNGKELFDYFKEQKDKGNIDEVTDNEDGKTITVEVDGYEITINKETLEILDTAKNGKTVKIGFNVNIVRVNETVTATIEFGDEIDTSNCKWVSNTDPSATIGESSYPNTNTFTSNTINLSATTEGTYYLHILVVDKDGNVTEKVSEKILVGNYVTGITLNKSELTLEEGKTENLTATVEPSDANNKTVEWTSSKEGVATVDQNGLVTAVAEGETTITVTAKDGSGVKAECKVTVTGKQPVQVTEDSLKGAYIKYDVTYIDSVYGLNFNFTETNGWRILNYEVHANDSTKLNKVEIISTGIPAMLQYQYSGTSANEVTWWDSTTQMDFYNNVLGGSSYGSHVATNKSLQVSSGLYNNFGSISFAYKASGNRGYNLGYFANTIKGANGMTYGPSNTNPVTGKDLFVIDGVATGVRTLTLPEVNKACGVTTSNSVAELTDATGLYKLRSLTLKNGSGTKVTPYSGGGAYWVASPWFSNTQQVCAVNYYRCHHQLLRHQLRRPTRGFSKFWYPVDTRDRCKWRCIL